MARIVLVAARQAVGTVGYSDRHLEAEAHTVHQARGTAEYSLLLDEMPSVVQAAGGCEPRVVFDDALHALNSARVRTTSLYPGVRETLDRLREAGVLIVAYTESIAFWTEWRIRHTGLDGVIDVLYSAPDHDLPKGLALSELRTKSEDHYGLKQTMPRHVPRGALKPNDAILRKILQDCGRAPAEAVYVGDSLMKDIAMAQSVGVLDVFAEYGLVQDRDEYNLLRRVTHWTEEDVEREKKLALNGEVDPTVVLKRGFYEVLPVFGLAPLDLA